MAEEIWKDIRGYEGYYPVSTFGNVRSSDRTVTSKLMVKCIVRQQKLLTIMVYLSIVYVIDVKMVRPLMGLVLSILI